MQGPIAALPNDLPPFRLSFKIPEPNTDRWLCYAWPCKLTLAAAASTGVRQSNVGARSNLRVVFRQGLRASGGMALPDMVFTQRLVTSLA